MSDPIILTHEQHINEIMRNWRGDSEMTDLGYMTSGILDNATDLYEIWRTQPWRRREFAKRELADIELAKDRLAQLEQFILIDLNRKLRGIA